MTSVEFFCEPETALKISLFFLKKENYINCEKYSERDNAGTLAVQYSLAESEKQLVVSDPCAEI